MTESSHFDSVRDLLSLQMFDATEMGILDTSTPDDEMPCVQFVAAELYVGVRVGDSFATVAQVDAWGVPFAEAPQAALVSAPPIEISASRGTVVIEDEEQVAALLLDPSRIEGLRVVGDVAVVPLAQSCVVVTGTDDEGGFERALQAADELLAAGSRLASIHPIGNRGGRWFPFPWRDRFAALANRISRATREFSVRGYRERRSALDAGDVRVLEPKLDKLDSGVTVTFATWLSGTAALLPVVDNVVVASREGAVRVMGFTQFMELAGDRVVRTELIPVRFYIPETLELAASS